MLNITATSSTFDQYDRYSSIGDYIGFAEMTVLLNYATWIAVMSVAGNYMALVMWLNIDENEDQKTHVNKLTKIQGYKWLAVGIMISLGGCIAALGLGEQATTLLGIYDNYSGIAADASGSSYFIDFTLRAVEETANSFVLTTIAWGGYIVGIFIMGAELNFS